MAGIQYNGAIKVIANEDIPTSTKRNKIMKGKTYIDKVLQTSIKNVNKNR